MFLAFMLLTVPFSIMSQQAPVAIAASLSAEEIAFAARLNDADRRAFVEQLTEEQRAQVMALTKSLGEVTADLR